MSYLFNTVDLYNSYGIRAGHAPGSNIALRGCFDLPSRTGKCFHVWGDADSIEPYAASGDIFFAGRDITFYGSILGSLPEVNEKLKTFYSAVSAASGVFETPYNSASGYVKSVIPEMLNGGAKIEMIFREPVVDLEGTLPAAGASNYTIDGIPFSSFGLYLSKSEALHDLPELKDQMFTRYGSEGYQITKRKNKTLEFNGFIAGSSLADFQSKVSALYKLFSSSGTRNIKINDYINVDCFATEGFKVSGIYLYNNLVIANFKASFMAVNVNYLKYLLAANGNYIVSASGRYILI